MITIYKNKKDIPQGVEYIELNDIYFNQNTVLKLDERAKKIIEQIDNAKLVSKYKIVSKFNSVILDIDCLSTGCKTVLNVLYNPEKVFCLKECGNNALEILYQLEKGMVYSDYALIPFNINVVVKCVSKTEQRIDDYEELKEWWNNEE